MLTSSRGVLGPVEGSDKGEGGGKTPSSVTAFLSEIRDGEKEG